MIDAMANEPVDIQLMILMIATFRIQILHWYNKVLSCSFLFCLFTPLSVFCRFLLSLASCKKCLVLDDQLRILPISTESRNITPIPPKSKV